MIITVMVTVDVNEASFTKELPDVSQDRAPELLEERVRWGVSNQLQLWDVDADVIGVEAQ